jgi:hypothetical protein
MAMWAACGDGSSPFIDAGNPHDHDASPLDGPESIDVDAGDIDAAPPDDASVVVDANTTPDAPPQSAMWRGAQPLENLTGSARRPVAGMDGAGRAFIAWINDIQDPQNETRFYGEVRVSRFDPTTGWVNATIMSPPATPESFADNLDLAVGVHGEAMVIWNQYNGTNDVAVMVRRFTPNGGWEPATVLFDATTTWASGRPAIAIADDGSAIAMWSQRGGDINLDSQLYARHFSPTVGWEPALPVHVVPGGDAIADEVAFDAGGHAVAVWTLHLSGSRVWSSRFSGNSWSTPMRLDEAAWAEGVIGTSGPRVAVDAAGNATVVFQAWNGDISGIWAAYGTADGAWQPATRLEEDSMYANDADVACDAMGNAMAVWQSWPADGPAMPSIRSRRFSPIHGWGAFQTIESFAADSSSPEIAMTPSGNATAVFVSDAAIWANRFVGVWGTPVRISSTGTGGYDEPVVAAGGLDSAVAAWPYNPAPIDNHPTPFDLWANVYR